MELKDLALVSNGLLHGDSLEISEFSIDTRSVKEGDVYIAIKGNNFDGHDFIEEAENKKAKALIVNKVVKFLKIQCLVLDQILHLCFLQNLKLRKIRFQNT